MESIRKYVANFLKKHKENNRFTISLSELMSAVDMAKNGKPVEAISDVFSFGYAKGYRVALAEMKKGGAMSG